MYFARFRLGDAGMFIKPGSTLLHQEEISVTDKDPNMKYETDCYPHRFNDVEEIKWIFYVLMTKARSPKT